MQSEGIADMRHVLYSLGQGQRVGEAVFNQESGTWVWKGWVYGSVFRMPFSPKAKPDVHKDMANFQQKFDVTNQTRMFSVARQFAPLTRTTFGINLWDA